LLKEELFLSNAVISNTFFLNFAMLSDNHLNIILEAIQKEKNMQNNKEFLISEIPNKFMNLLNLKIFDKIVFSNSNLWKEFAF